jgi:hypothetical protein
MTRSTLRRLGYSSVLERVVWWRVGGMFGLTSEQCWLIVISGALLVLAHQVNELRESRKPRLKPKVRRALLWANPITVKHDTPRSLTPDEKECFGAEKHDFECFQSFWYFADCINKLYSDLSGPIRLQELGDTLIQGSLSNHGPAYGRRYDIFYNQCKIGLLEICAGLDRHFDPENKSVDLEITIDRVPPTMLPYSVVYGFLQSIASLVTSAHRPKYPGNTAYAKTEYQHAMSEIRTAISELMWNMHRDDDWFSELQIELSGTPDHYYRLLELKLDQDGRKTAASAHASTPHQA